MISNKSVGDQRSAKSLLRLQYDREATLCRGEGVSRIDIGEKSTPDRGNSKCQGLKAGVFLVSCCGHSSPQNWPLPCWHQRILLSEKDSILGFTGPTTAPS